MDNKITGSDILDIALSERTSLSYYPLSCNQKEVKALSFQKTGRRKWLLGEGHVREGQEMGKGYRMCQHAREMSSEREKETDKE